jgi:hypothetical protein
LLIAGLLVVVVAMFGLIQSARGQEPPTPTKPGAATRETDGDNVREVTGTTLDGSPHLDIGFIDSPTATCYQPDAAVNACYINWYYLSVSAAPNYMITMTATLNDFGIVAYMSGFFQTSMYAPYAMFDRGFRVACGAPNSGGNPDLGKAYGYTIRARDSAGLASANYGTVYCPAYRPH